jgi:hypothetical protein
MDSEEKDLLNSYQKGLASYYMEQKVVVEKEKDYRQNLRDKYKKDAELRKYKHRLALRQQSNNSAQVLESIMEYSEKFLWRSTDDPTLYAYQRKLCTALQWNIVSGAPVGVALCYALLRSVRMLKKTGGYDGLFYFLIPLVYWSYTKSIVYHTSLFEIGYPAHPTIIERRRKVINESCFYAPNMIKNEIEYMHSRIEGVDIDDEEAQL